MLGMYASLAYLGGAAVTTGYREFRHMTVRADEKTAERFQPAAHVAPDTFMNKLLFNARLMADFQLKTIHRHLKSFLPGVSGTIADVGAGQSPFKHLLNKEVTRYVALDIYTADDFGYRNPDVVQFDGQTIPLDADSVDAVLCTEVLEHVENAQALVDEMHRIVKPGGPVVITVPWSARYHYIPHDYHRFTPSRLANIFAAFSSVRVQPRGTDITAIVSKLIVAYLRLLRPRHRLWLLVTLLVAIAFAPLLAIAVLVGHASVHLGFGSADDPLGYTVWAKK
jgi:2-polyprenyl-3-methyl-5-hydroxy-6-metoxy-1,4-benzoquinol methylase